MTSACRKASFQTITDFQNQGKKRDSQNNRSSKTPQCYLQLQHCFHPPGFVCRFPYLPFGLPARAVFDPERSRSHHSFELVVSVTVSPERRMEGRISYMVKSLSKAGHVKFISAQNITQNFKSLFLQLLYDLKKSENNE